MSNIQALVDALEQLANVSEKGGREYLVKKIKSIRSIATQALTGIERGGIEPY